MNANELHRISEKYRNLKWERIFNYAQMFDSYSEYAKHIQGRKVRLGMPTLDNLLGMIRPSQLCTIIGATNVGKTTLAMHICYHNSLAMQDGLILMFNLEIDENEILERTLCTEFDITSYDVEKAFANDDVEKFKPIIQKYSNFISIIGRVEVDHVIPFTKAVEEIYQKPVRLVVIDYLGLLKNRQYRDRREKVSANIEMLKEICLHLQLPIIDISQTSREYSKKEVDLYSAKESGEVENSSQIVIGINKLTEKDKIIEKGLGGILSRVENNEVYLLEAKIEKKKQGDYGKCYLIQERRNLRIKELTLQKGDI